MVADSGIFSVYAMITWNWSLKFSILFGMQKKKDKEHNNNITI